MESLGELLDERGERVAPGALDRLPVHVHAGDVVLPAPGGDGLGVAAARLRRLEDRRRDRRVEGVPGLVVVGERDEDAAILALRLVNEVLVEARRGDAAVGARLQPVDADLVDGARLHRCVERGPVAEGPGADEVWAVRPVVVERACQREGDGDGDQTRDDDDEQSRKAPPPARPGAAALETVGARGHGLMMTARPGGGKPRRGGRVTAVGEDRRLRATLAWVCIVHRPDHHEE